MHGNHEQVNQHKIDQYKMMVVEDFYAHINPVDMHVHDQYDRQ